MTDYVVTDNFGKVKSRLIEVRKECGGYELSDMARKCLEDSRREKLADRMREDGYRSDLISAIRESRRK